VVYLIAGYEIATRILFEALVVAGESTGVGHPARVHDNRRKNRHDRLETNCDRRLSLLRNVDRDAPRCKAKPPSSDYSCSDRNSTKMKNASLVSKGANSGTANRDFRSEQRHTRGVCHRPADVTVSLGL
jgi:hypothetical protein